MASDSTQCECGVCSGFMTNTALASVLESSSDVTTESTSNISSENSIAVTRLQKSGNAYINSLTWNNGQVTSAPGVTPVIRSDDGFTPRWDFNAQTDTIVLYYFFVPAGAVIDNQLLGLWGNSTETWPTNVTESAIAALEAFTACFRDSESSGVGYGMELEEVIVGVTPGVATTQQAVDLATFNFMYSNDPALSSYSGGVRTGITLGMCGPPNFSNDIPNLSGALLMNQYGAVNDPSTGTFNGANDNWTASASINPGGGFFSTFLHELGHGFGMAHPFDNGGGFSGIFPGVASTYSLGDNGLNISTYSIMSYTNTQVLLNIYGTSSTGTEFSSGFPATPMAFDYATLNFLYGFNPTYITPGNTSNNGDQTYVIADGTNTGGYTCITSNSIAGSGSNDLIIYDGSSAVTIDLRPASIANAEGGGGYVSKLNGSTNVQGFTIGADMQVEKATGGDGNDTIWQVDSQSNIIDGRAGIDQVNYNDIQEAYIMDYQNDASGNYTLVERFPIEADSLANYTDSMLFQVPLPTPDAVTGTTTNPTIAYFCYTHNTMIDNFTIDVADDDSYNEFPVEITVRVNGADPSQAPYYYFYPNDLPGTAPLNGPSTPMQLRMGTKYLFVRSDTTSTGADWNAGDHPFNVGSSWKVNDTGMYVASFFFNDPSLLVTSSTPIAAASDKLYNIENLGFQYGNVTFAICFRKGTSILCLVDGEEKQVPIQKIKKGDLVKTYNHGYKKVEDTEYTYSSMCNKLSSLYKLPMGTYSGMTDDLYITGGHSLLVDKLSENERDNMSRISWKPHLFKIADKHKLLAMYNPKMERITERDKVYHIVLEQIDERSNYSAYGVYANGVLAESCSRRALQMHRKRSGKGRRITASA